MNLIDEADGYDVVYRWYDYLKQEGNFIHAYVIMPNRMHSIISFAKNGQNINTTVGNGKRFMAYEIVERLKVANKPQLLDTLSLAVPVNRKQRNQKHSIWEPTFDWKYCYGMEFILQKLEYIHSNPCRGKWDLCRDPTEYIHSSAKFYMTGDAGIYPVTHVGELSEIKLIRDELALIAASCTGDAAGKKKTLRKDCMVSNKKTTYMVGSIFLSIFITTYRDNSYTSFRFRKDMDRSSRFSVLLSQVLA